MPSIDILIPVYNPLAVNFEDCIRSLNRQTFKDFRVIFINDGGRIDFYNSLKLCEFSYLLIENSKNSGISSALNLGIKHASAPFVARMDSDDICHRDRFATQYQIMVENSELDLIFTSVTKFSSNQDIPFPSDTDISIFFDSREIAGYLAFRNILTHPTAFMKSSVLHKYNYDTRLRKSQDYDLWMRMLRDGLNIRFYLAPLLKYRVDDANTNKLQAFIFNITRQKLAPEVVSYWFGDNTGALIHDLYNYKSLTGRQWVEFFKSPVPKRLLLKEIIRRVIT